MVVSLLLFDEVTTAVRNSTRLTAFDMGHVTSYAGPVTAAADALLAFVFRFLERCLRDF